MSDAVERTEPWRAEIDRFRAAARELLDLDAIRLADPPATADPSGLLEVPEGLAALLVDSPFGELPPDSFVGGEAVEPREAESRPKASAVVGASHTRATAPSSAPGRTEATVARRPARDEEAGQSPEQPPVISLRPRRQGEQAGSSPSLGKSAERIAAAAGSLTKPTSTVVPTRASVARPSSVLESSGRLLAGEALRARPADRVDESLADAASGREVRSSARPTLRDAWSTTLGDRPRATTDERVIEDAAETSSEPEDRRSARPAPREPWSPRSLLARLADGLLAPSAVELVEPRRRAPFEPGRAGARLRGIEAIAGPPPGERVSRIEASEIVSALREVDADAIADLVNESLVEQALRHGVDFS